MVKMICYKYIYFTVDSLSFEVINSLIIMNIDQIVSMIIV